MGAAHVSHPLFLTSSALSHIDGHPGGPRCVPLHLWTGLQVAGLVLLNERPKKYLYDSTSICLLLHICLGGSYQCTSWATVPILTGADPGVDASPTLRAALGPGGPWGPENRLRTGHRFITEPMNTVDTRDGVTQLG